jgi:hypothetical protein
VVRMAWHARGQCPPDLASADRPRDVVRMVTVGGVPGRFSARRVTASCPGRT